MLIPSSRKKPPFFNELRLNKGDCLIICTGSNAWERGKSLTWNAKRKLVLPPGDDPTFYDWQIASGYDVIICGFGDLGPISTIAKLGALLLSAGAKLILYAPEHGPLTKIVTRRVA